MNAELTPDLPDRHVFDVSLDLSPAGSGPADTSRYSGEALAAFENAIGPFGGWSAALLARAALQAARDAGAEGLELISLTTDFAAGVPTGPVMVTAVCDRAGRNTQFWSVAIRDPLSGSVLVKASAILSRRRETTDWVESRMPDIPAPELCPRRDIPRNWADHIDLRHATLERFTDTGSTHSTAWARLDAGRPLDAESLVCLADTPMSRIFLVLSKPVVMSTVSMTVYLHATEEDYAATADDFVLLETHGARGGRGFYDQHARVWSRDGRLLATTQQSVWFNATDRLEDGHDEDEA
ncbi:acyl-CoA thioesterase [Maricaulis sp. D1M11]|uniref:acyl-CoA thioesterase n=1 Tax=Maricaulis sp. D1M11 TaxID=3076117 RepID=UPI0039B3D6B7